MTIPGLWAVVPVFNEAATLAAVVSGLRPYCPVIVVDDASTDDSAAVARRAGAAAVARHARRSGKGAALRTGFTAALGRRATSVVTVDGDGQHDPRDLPRLARAARGAPDALVLGNRLAMPAGDRMPLLRRLAIRAADRALAPLLLHPVCDTQCGFRVYPAAFLREVGLGQEGFVLETEALVRAVEVGYRVLSVPVRRLYPAGRQSRFRAVSDAARIARYLVRARYRAPAPALPIGDAPVASSASLAGKP